MRTTSPMQNSGAACDPAAWAAAVVVGRSTGTSSGTAAVLTGRLTRSRLRGEYHQTAPDDDLTWTWMSLLLRLTRSTLPSIPRVASIAETQVTRDCWSSRESANPACPLPRTRRTMLTMSPSWNSTGTGSLSDWSGVRRLTSSRLKAEYHQVLLSGPIYTSTP